MKITITTYDNGELIFENVESTSNNGEWLTLNGETHASFVQVIVKLRDVLLFSTENED